ncbi:MAG: glycosyltransferase family 4 protein [Candidatus Sumerlaeia bacterium]
MPLTVFLMNSSRRWIGEAAHTLMLARLLEGAGHRVLLGCRRGRELEKAAGAIHLPALPLTFSSRLAPLHDLQDVMRVRRAVKTSGFQIVHCHRGKEHWTAWLALAGLRRRVLLVRTRHVVTPLRTHWPNRMLFERCTDGLIAVSRAALESFGPMLERIPPRRVAVIYSAVDSERFHPCRRDEELRRSWGVEPGGLAIGLVARFQHIKGQRVFLQAAAEVAHKAPGVRFVLFGRRVGVNAERLRRWAAELNLPDEQVVVEGRDLPVERVVASLDVGVSASLGSEGFSRIAVEYMASGLPVVATRVGALPEIVLDGETGFIVPSRDPAALAARLTLLCRDGALRARLGEAARARAVSKFHPARFLGDTVAFYEALLEDKGLAGNPGRRRHPGTHHGGA